ncbi:MAG: phosphoribosylanthranilate isomerase [Planctomycetes bacterium]|nr:phosphoribosylanthranilate isomerase [Planctomycetota bacterium]
MWVKICGIRDESTARLVCQFSPSAIGLNFYSKSPRFIDSKQAELIGQMDLGNTQRIGVFVNSSTNEVEDSVHRFRLEGIQYHGNERPNDLAEIQARLPNTDLLRAWRMSGERLDDFSQYWEECRALNVRLAACLVDSHVPGAFGGTGQKVSWTGLARVYDRDKWPRLIVAGGLNSQNVLEAIRESHCWGVDVASGVESAPGVKNFDQVRLFCANANRNSSQ